MQTVEVLLTPRIADLACLPAPWRPRDLRACCLPNICIHIWAHDKFCVTATLLTSRVFSKDVGTDCCTTDAESQPSPHRLHNQTRQLKLITTMLEQSKVAAEIIEHTKMEKTP